MSQNKPRASTIYQANVLSERYFDVMLSDLGSLLLMFLQPLAVAICIGLVWQGGRTTGTLYFVLIFSTIFFGCVNACREIVKETAIFQRERLVGLRITPYILSKIWVLSGLGLAQTLLFYTGVRYFLSLEGGMLTLLLTLYLSLLAGTALGLVISAAVSSDVMALALVPVCLIPQLLFSKMVMPQKALTGLVAWLEKSMIVRWSYQAMEEVVAKSPAWGTWLEGIAVLLMMSVLLTLLSGLILKLKVS